MLTHRAGRCGLEAEAHQHEHVRVSVVHGKFYKRGTGCAINELGRLEHIELLLRTTEGRSSESDGIVDAQDRGRALGGTCVGVNIGRRLCASKPTSPYRFCSPLVSWSDRALGRYSDQATARRQSARAWARCNPRRRIVLPNCNGPDRLGPPPHRGRSRTRCPSK